MSFNLELQPPPQARKTVSLSKALKYILARRYFDQDGSCSSDWTTIGTGELPYLYGIRDGSTDAEVSRDIQKVIDMIEKHGSCEIRIA